jgi:hypothetical protein
VVQRHVVEEWRRDAESLTTEGMEARGKEKSEGAKRHRMIPVSR